MNRFLRTLCVLVMLAMVAPALAATDVEAVKQRVAKVDVLRGEFSQEKQVAGFKNPLRSQGRFVLAQDHGVIWTTLKPFPSEVVVTRDRILSRQSDGSSRVELDGRQQPAMRSVNAIMFALMSGDAQALSAQFTVKVEVLPGNAWKMQLTPRSAMLGKVFAQLTLSGDRYVREVQINEANQDVTRIQFAGMSDTPATLSTDEGRRFE
ncbi:LolA family protein [Stenotrophomonas rhizophila]|uniref:Outer membrane lipoprotein-sorting protein n=1 Tax=Stenotrophomonas rhizophila TaxID=216778 RepID=A0A498CIE6_9GAMM|nr:outer membrane lipoprotein carrier protein LolA [Stenotrophomonas rhizophila]MBU2048802.1 outer membrane lipoprotein carrier protein LolA [Gammaproteobacteria bacterium]RLK57839.1 outer membrane lipoprotein-sorting protein [Stenotrophomonas rhizophila]